ncbi:MAG: acyl-CoA reductase [Bernardetiaceae bacterium]|nr:acyl-CoA reductase [Bernardetiaceae bacterium]
MNFAERLEALARLGEHLAQLPQAELEPLASQAYLHNHWFTRPNVELALAGVAHLLARAPLQAWASEYAPLASGRPARRVGLVLAGNLPLVGAHDLICGWLSGHHLLVKPSSQDPVLPRQLYQWLLAIEPRFAGQLTWVERLEKPEAVIATGGDNTARYFDYYFGKYPHIIRRNRTSVAVLNGHETPAQLAALGQDVLQYFGLGCRSVAKLYVPEGYDFAPFYEALAPLEESVAQHSKYVNNYDYNKSIYLVNRAEHLDNGFLLLKPDAQLVSPVAVLYYQTYRQPAEWQAALAELASKIQCKVGAAPGLVPFGQAQCPGIGDYADGADTMQFLLAL